MLLRRGEPTTRGRPRQQIKPARVKVDREGERKEQETQKTTTKTGLFEINLLFQYFLYIPASWEMTL